MAQVWVFEFAAGAELSLNPTRADLGRKSIWLSSRAQGVEEEAGREDMREWKKKSRPGFKAGERAGTRTPAEI